MGIVPFSALRRRVAASSTLTAAALLYDHLLEAFAENGMIIGNQNTFDS